LAAGAAISALLCGTLLWTMSDRIVDLLVQPLEQRFQRADITAPETLVGIIVLTGDDERLLEAADWPATIPISRW
jgi:hypothetical protein